MKSKPVLHFPDRAGTNYRRILQFTVLPHLQVAASLAQKHGRRKKMAAERTEILCNVTFMPQSRRLMRWTFAGERFFPTVKAVAIADREKT